MKNCIVYLSLGVIGFSSVHAQSGSGQQIYQPYADAPSVTVENGRVLAFPWAGGLDNPQLSMGDINNDGIKDLVIFDPNGGVKTFINKSRTPGNPQYVYAPEYADNFPNVNVYMMLRDFNRDGIPDLVFRGNPGITVYRGRWQKDNNNKDRISFDLNTKFHGFDGLHYNDAVSGWTNVFVATADYPGVEDIDGDGDLDIVTYDLNGVFMYYFRNCQAEDRLPNDSITICLKDACWGKVKQNYERTLALAQNCDGIITPSCKGCNSGEKTTHSGNTVCLLDMDNDGDYDVLNGNVSFSDIQYLKNGRVDYGYNKDSIIAQDTSWQGRANLAPMKPVAFWLDINNDGVKDIAAAPFAQGFENYKSLSYFKNTGTTAHPNYVFQTDTLLMQDMIDVGSNSAPVFYDYNKDGKIDLFVNSRGLYQQINGTMKSSIYYYENTGIPSKPAYTLKSRDFMGLSGNNDYRGGTLAFGDLDADGKDDMIIGSSNGQVFYFHNTAASASVQPVWTFTKILNDQSGTLDVGNYASPCIYDLDKDGDNDLIIGCDMGRLYYYSNSGGSNPFFRRVTDTLGHIFIVKDEDAYTYLSPFIGKIDNSGKDYLLIGTKYGMIYCYDNFQSGNEKATYTLVDSNYSYINAYRFAKPTVADIDGDGFYEMAVGDQVGGIKMYKQYFNVGISDQQMANGGVKIYPNPSNTMINISWLPGIGSGKLDISLISVTGQRVYNTETEASRTNAQIDVSALPSGTYYCIIRCESTQVASPVSVIH